MEYRFDWGDGSLSDWSTDSTAPHSWGSFGNYSVKAMARCATHLDIESAWSDVRMVSVDETVSEPAEPQGADSICVGEAGVYYTGGGESSCGHSLEYQLDWGDGTDKSGWSTSVYATHSYAVSGTHGVKARARCSVHTEKESAWSSALPVTVPPTIYLKTSWDCGGEPQFEGNYPQSHLPKWVTDEVSYDPTSSDCEPQPDRCFAIFWHFLSQTTGELTDSGPEHGMYVSPDTKTIKVSFRGDSRTYLSSSCMASVTVGTCTLFVSVADGSCSVYTLEFDKAGCSSGDYIPVKLSVEASVLQGVEISWIQVDFEGWCG